jgi:ABC-2 type transport system permease protein
MAEALGVSSGRPTDAMVALTQLYIAIIATAYAVQGVASLRGEENAGRLEARLSGTLSRVGWLVAHALVIVVGLLVIVVVSSVVLAAGTAWSTGTAVDVGRILAAGAAYLPAELLVAGLALALFGHWPRALPIAWATVAFVAFIAFLGPGLRLPRWMLDLSPTTHVGNPPLGTVEGLPLVVLGTITAVLGGAAVMGFRRRGVPQH